MARVILLTKEHGTWVAWECAPTGLDDSMAPESVVELVSASNPDATVVVASENHAAARAQREGLAEANERHLIRW